MFSAPSDVPAWSWNELNQVGTDYADIAEVERYDRRMSQLRDLAAEARATLAGLRLPSSAVLIDMGCGTAHFSLAAAAECRQVVAVDISRPMLEYAASKARAAGLDNIHFHLGGYLTYRHTGEAADAVVSSLSLHHLPDYWKAAALRRIAAMLKPGGQFFLRDVVLPAEPAPEDLLPGLVENCPEPVRPGFIGHLSREYSTTDWIMRGLLQRAGFTIESERQENGFLTTYFCRVTS